MGISLDPFSSQSESVDVDKTTVSGSQTEQGGAASTTIDAYKSNIQVTNEFHTTDLGAVERAFFFAGESLDFAQGSLDDNLALAQENITFAQSTLRDGLEFGAGSLDLINQFALNALSGVSEFADATFEASNDERLLTARLQTETLATLTEAQAESIEAISESTRSEASESFDKLVKVAGLAVGAIALLFFFRRRAA